MSQRAETVQHAGVLLPLFIHPIKAFKRFPATPVSQTLEPHTLNALISLSEPLEDYAVFKIKRDAQKW